MTINKLAQLIAKRESKKKQVDIAQIKEILGIIADLQHEGKLDHTWALFYYLGIKRAKRKAK